MCPIKSKVLLSALKIALGEKAPWRSNYNPTASLSELEKLKSFKGRMEKTLDQELGSSGLLSEDLNNPCRESELKVMYNKLRQSLWADFLCQIKTKPEYKDIKKEAEKRMKDFPTHLASECYKMGFLMALHNPPVLLDWNNSLQGPFPPIMTVRLSMF
ncbi:hypothetical protein MHYP_G00329640 [Metynnis hypsauchen]